MSTTIFRSAVDGAMRRAVVPCSVVSSAAEGRFTSYAVARDQVVSFERILAKYGIQIRPGSKLEAACLLAMELPEQQRDPTRRVSIPRLRDDLPEVVGLLQLVHLLLDSTGHVDFARLVPHLRELNKGSPAQNTFAPPSDQASNKLFELLVALAAMGTGRDLRLDDPRSADGSNPDVLVTFPSGTRWGFACKVIHGDAPMTLFDRILEGIDQIERSSAETGMVVVNFKNRLPHPELFPLMAPDSETGEVYIGAHASAAAVAARLADLVQARTVAMEQEVGRAPIIEAFRGRKALPGLLVVIEATAGVDTPRGPSPSMVGVLHLITFELAENQSRFDPAVEEVIASMNTRLQLRELARHDGDVAKGA